MENSKIKIINETLFWKCSSDIFQAFLLKISESK